MNFFSGTFLSFDTINYLSWFAPSINLFYYEIPKCGCTSTLSFLEHIINRHKKSRGDIHERRGSLWENSKFTSSPESFSSAIKILNDSASLKFTVVRDPMDRFLSSYYDKFVGNPDPSIIKSLGFDYSVSYILPTPVEVITRLRKLNRANIDIHFLPISDLIKPIRHYISHIVSIECVEPLLLRGISGVSSATVGNFPKLNESHKPGYTEMKSEYLLSENLFTHMVQKFYARDFYIYDQALKGTTKKLP